VLTYLLKFHTA